MPATDYHELYQIENVLEQAVAAHLDGVVPPAAARTSDEIVDPVARVSVSVTSKGPSGGCFNDGTNQYQNRYNGTLTVMLSSRRSDDTARGLFHERLGEIRWRMQDIASITALMPNHELHNIAEQGANRSIDSDRDEDIVEVDFEFGLAIRADAWPEPET